MEFGTVPPQPTQLTSSEAFHLPTPPPHQRESFRDVVVKVHIRRPERDSWMYLGKGIVTQEVYENSSQVVVRSLASKAELAVFSEESELQVEKRGNFVVICCVEGAQVVSWSLNASNNIETLRLLASIELACYRCKQATLDPFVHAKVQRRIDRTIREDRRRRRRRRKDQEALADAFAKQDLGDLMPTD